VEVNVSVMMVVDDMTVEVVALVAVDCPVCVVVVNIVHV
jgi:hypothetical protein